MASGKGVLRRAVDGWYEDFNLGKRFGNWLRDNTEQHNQRFGDAYKQFLDELGVDTSEAPFLTPGSPPAVAGGVVALIPVLLGMLLGAGIGIGVSVISPLTLKWSYSVARKFRPWRPDPKTIDDLLFRFPQLSGVLDGYSRDIGIPDEVRPFLQALARPIISPDENLRLWLREEITDNELSRRLQAVGFLETDVQELRKLAEIIPGPQDLISMAVREAFDDDVANQFGYDEAFPSEFGNWTEKQGLGVEWAQRYWRAHWQLPSPNQVFEMFQRLRPDKSSVPVTDDTLRQYLRVADLAPFWRDRLTEISYSPITRVDVRRMYVLLGWSREELVSRYLDLGYSPDDAANYADFTIKYETPQESELTRSAILQGYRRKVLTRGETFEALGDIGVRDDVASFYVALEDKQENEKILSQELDRIEDLFLLGELDDSTVYNELGPLNLTGEQSNRIVLGWSAKRRSKQAIPTKTELDRWYKFELIDQDEYRDGLLKRNIHPDYVDFYLAETDVEISEERDKEFERTKKEQERVRGNRRSTQYQKDKALLEVQIAEVKVSIADMKVAVYLADEVELIDKLKERILIMQKLLADLGLEKANLRSELETDRVQELSDNAQ